MPEHHLIFDFLGQEVDLSFELEGVVGLESVTKDGIDVGSHDMLGSNNKNVINREIINLLSNGNKIAF